MDKRFFLALFLSLIAIAVSQLLFPPAKPVPNQRNAAVVDSGKPRPSQSSTSSTSPALTAAAVAPSQGATVAGRIGASVPAAAEIAAVETQKAIYGFSSVGAAPVSVIVRDYKNRAGTGGPVRFEVANSPLLHFRLITPTDTADLSQLPFALSRATASNGDETLTYSTNVGSHAVSISLFVRGRRPTVRASISFPLKYGQLGSGSHRSHAEPCGRSSSFSFAAIRSPYLRYLPAAVATIQRVRHMQSKPSSDTASSKACI